MHRTASRKSHNAAASRTPKSSDKGDKKWQLIPSDEFDADRDRNGGNLALPTVNQSVFSPEPLSKVEDGTGSVDGLEDEGKDGPPSILGNGIMRRSRGRFAFGSRLPPQIDAVLVVGHRYRFVTSVTGIYNVTPAMLFGVCGGFCTIANSQHRSWAGTIRAKRVTLFLPSVTSGTNSADVVWLSNDLNRSRDSEELNSTPTGITNCNSMTSVPPGKTAQQLWFTSSATGASFLSLSVVVGTIIDLDLTFTLNCNFTGAANTIAVGMLGNTYYLALDGPASNKLIPVGLPTTA